MGRKFGISFSWKRATGLSAAKGKLSRAIGVPLTREGRRRKFGPFGLGLFTATGGGGKAKRAEERVGNPSNAQRQVGSGRKPQPVTRVGGFSVLAQRPARSSNEHANHRRFWTAPIRALIRLIGIACILLAVVLGLFALFGYLSSKDQNARLMSVVFGGVALLLLVLGIRAFWHGGRHDSVVLTPSAKSAEPSSTGLHYDDFKWRDPAPSYKQFVYAIHLGVKVHHGMTKWTMSDAIDAAIEQQRSGEPATKEQLKTIDEHHGVLPRAITRGEANRVIEFLEDHSLPCPFCGVDIAASDDVCCACNKSLRRMKIPIKL